MFTPVPEKYDLIQPDMEMLALYVQRNKGIIEYDDCVTYAIENKISPNAIMYHYEIGTCDSEVDLNIIRDITKALLGPEYEYQYVAHAHKIMRHEYVTPEEYIEIVEQDGDE